MPRRLIAEVQSDVSGPLNPAYVGFAFASTSLTINELCADVVAYLGLALNVLGEEDLKIMGIRSQVLPGGTLTDNAFPTAEFAAWQAYLPTPLAGITDWGVAIPTVSGTQYSSGRGDSVCVNTVTGMGGRHGVGRHFLPFLTRDAIGFDGLIDVGYKSQVETNYGTCFLGQGAGSPPAIGDAAPIVFSPTTNAEYDVQFPKIQRVPSRLRSRTK